MPYPYWHKRFGFMIKMFRFWSKNYSLAVRKFIQTTFQKWRPKWFPCVLGWAYHLVWWTGHLSCRGWWLLKVISSKIYFTNQSWTFTSKGGQGLGSYAQTVVCLHLAANQAGTAVDSKAMAQVLKRKFIGKFWEILKANLSGSWHEDEADLRQGLLDCRVFAGPWQCSLRARGRCQAWIRSSCSSGSLSLTRF